MPLASKKSSRAIIIYGRYLVIRQVFSRKSRESKQRKNRSCVGGIGILHYVLCILEAKMEMLVGWHG
jgi:hypothetical protein